MLSNDNSETHANSPWNCSAYLGATVQIVLNKKL